MYSVPSSNSSTAPVIWFVWFHLDHNPVQIWCKVKGVVVVQGDRGKAIRPSCSASPHFRVVCRKICLAGNEMCIEGLPSKLYLHLINFHKVLDAACFASTAYQKQRHAREAATCCHLAAVKLRHHDLHCVSMSLLNLSLDSQHPS